MHFFNPFFSFDYLPTMYLRIYHLLDYLPHNYLLFKQKLQKKLSWIDLNFISINIYNQPT
jgi:hypothetical protein